MASMPHSRTPIRLVSTKGRELRGHSMGLLKNDEGVVKVLMCYDRHRNERNRNTPIYDGEAQ